MTETPRKSLMMILWLAILLIVWSLFVWAGSATGQCTGPSCTLGNRPLVPVVRPNPAVVRIVNISANAREYGSGAMIADDRVITCKHLFSEGVGEIIVTLADGRRFGANLLARSQQGDLALLETRPTGAPVLRIAAQRPRAGELVTACGFGPDGRFRLQRGRVLGNIMEHLALIGAVRQGDSGGPILNSRGELAGVLWGTDGRMIVGTSCVHIHAFLRRVEAERKPEPQPTEPAPLPQQPKPPDEEPPDKTPATPETTNDPAASMQVEPLCERLDDLESMINGIASATRGQKAPTYSWQATLLTALGWSGPPAIAVMFLAQLAKIYWRRRREEGKHQEQDATPPQAVASSVPPLSGATAPNTSTSEPNAEPVAGDTPGEEAGPADQAGVFCSTRETTRGLLPRDNDEALQLLRLSKLEGRDPVHDAIVGRLALDELANTIDADKPGADFARDFRRTLEDRFNQIAPLSLIYPETENETIPATLAG